MLILSCPYCGPREQEEFAYGGEAHIARPTNSDMQTDREWAEYVFMRSNTKGVFAERWNHAAGCRKWFNVVRNTATDKILAIYEQGAARPTLSVEGEQLATPSGEPKVGSGNDAAKVVRSDEKDGASA